MLPVRRSGLVLTVFMGRFTLENDNFNTIEKPFALSNLRVLDLGLSHSSRNEDDNKEAGSYIRACFPNVLICGYSKRILSLFNHSWDFYTLVLYSDFLWTLELPPP